MSIYYFIAVMFVSLVLLLDTDVLAFSSNKYLRCLKIILLGAAIGTVARYIFGRFPASTGHNIGTILMVWWEDALFSLLPIYYGRKFLPARISTIITILASLAFGAAHLYISTGWAIISCLYPYFIAYRIGSKYGYGTVMATHITYDLTIVATQALLLSTL